MEPRPPIPANCWSHEAIAEAEECESREWRMSGGVGRVKVRGEGHGLEARIAGQG